MQRIELSDGEKHTPEQLAWARSLGVVTDRVALPNVITVDDDAGTVTVDRYYEVDMKGLPIVAKDGDGEYIPVTRRFIVALDKPADPYPA